MQSLLQALGERLDGPCAARLAAVGVDVAAPLLDAYPVSVFAQAVRVAGAALVPEGPEEAGVREAGRRFVRRFRTTHVGRAGLSLLRLMGPEALVRRLEQAIRTGDNYTRCRAEQRGERHFEVHFQPAQLPAFYEGLLEEGLAAVGAREVRAVLVRPLEDGLLFDVRWE
jgi:uncharacterized protein (TIGR02265 family)